jgi:hypothetical protein
MVSTNRWFVSKSAVRGEVKKPEGQQFAGYFYTGPSQHFGHFPPRKKGKKK